MSGPHVEQSALKRVRFSSETSCTMATLCWHCATPHDRDEEDIVSERTAPLALPLMQQLPAALRRCLSGPSRGQAGSANLEYSLALFPTPLTHHRRRTGRRLPALSEGA